MHHNLIKLKIKRNSTAIRYALIKILLLAILSLIAGGIYADTASTPNCTGGPNPVVTLNIPTSINIAAIPANAPIITPLTDWFSLTTLSFTGCRASSSNNIRYAMTSSFPDTNAKYIDNGVSYNIYSISTGIGIILSVQNPLDPSSKPTPLIRMSQVLIPIKSNGDFNTTYRARLIRYSTIPKGSTSIQSDYLMSGQDWLYYGVGSTAPHIQDVYIGGSTINTQTTSCTVNTNNITVQLPSIPSSQLNSIGATGGTTPFNIAINCPSPVNVYMTITDNINPASVSDTLTARSDSTSKGLGIQVRKNNIPILMGPDSSMAGNKNQFLAGSNITGIQTIPLTANYIRTSTVSAGTLKAVATFTMSYQ